VAASEQLLATQPCPTRAAAAAVAV